MTMILLYTSFHVFLSIRCDTSWTNSKFYNMLTVSSILQPIYHMWISHLLTLVVILTSINFYAWSLNILKALIILTLVLLQWRFWYLSKASGILTVVLQKLLALNVLIKSFLLIDFLNVLVTILSWICILRNLDL